MFLRRDVCELLRGFVGAWAHGPLFRTRQGRRLTVRQVQRRLGYWLERAGCRPACPHALRHTFGLALYRRTGDPFVVQAALGNAALASTLVYARPEPERLRAMLG